MEWKLGLCRGNVMFFRRQHQSQKEREGERARLNVGTVQKKCSDLRKEPPEHKQLLQQLKKNSTYFNYACH